MKTLENMGIITPELKKSAQEHKEFFHGDVQEAIESLEKGINLYRGVDLTGDNGGRKIKKRISDYRLMILYLKQEEMKN